MEQQFITQRHGASCFMHGDSFRPFINELALTGLFVPGCALCWPPLCGEGSVHEAQEETETKMKNTLDVKVNEAE